MSEPSPQDVILRPVVTEESMKGIDRGRYVFLVDRRATRTEIKRAVEQVFHVKVARVNTVILPGKRRRLRASEGRTPDRKKAYVILRPGQKIDFFEGLR
ncbi:MAG: 50S ribosomal protein L23 [Bacillota bacterium]|nr:50S ribosomal protein L23 [Bacillota bacterium]